MVDTAKRSAIGDWYIPMGFFRDPAQSSNETYNGTAVGGPCASLSHTLEKTRTLTRGGEQMGVDRSWCPTRQSARRSRTPRFKSSATGRWVSGPVILGRWARRD